MSVNKNDSTGRMELLFKKSKIEFENSRKPVKQSPHPAEIFPARTDGTFGRVVSFFTCTELVKVSKKRIRS